MVWNTELAFPAEEKILLINRILPKENKIDSKVCKGHWNNDRILKVVTRGDVPSAGSLWVSTGLDPVSSQGHVGIATLLAGWAALSGTDEIPKFHLLCSPTTLQSMLHPHCNIKLFSLTGTKLSFTELFWSSCTKAENELL